MMHNIENIPWYRQLTVYRIQLLCYCYCTYCYYTPLVAMSIKSRILKISCKTINARDENIFRTYSISSVSTFDSADELKVQLGHG